MAATCACYQKTSPQVAQWWSQMQRSICAADLYLFGERLIWRWAALQARHLPLGPQQLLLSVQLHLLYALQCCCVARLVDLLLSEPQPWMSPSISINISPQPVVLMCLPFD